MVGRLIIRNNHSLQNFEDNKRREMKRLEESLEEVAESSKRAKEDVDKERGSLDRVKSEFINLREELESVRRDKAKLETDHKNLQVRLGVGSQLDEFYLKLRVKIIQPLVSSLV